MATFPSSASSSFSVEDHCFPRFDLESLKAFVILVDGHMSQFLMHPSQRKSLKLQCVSKLQIRRLKQRDHFFEFADHSVVSNLYWGIEKIESALKLVRFSEPRIVCLQKAEEMLQIPALLDEHGRTGAVANRYIVACAYFYLSLVWKLRSEEIQMTAHFLQAMLVSPGDIRKEFAPSLWKRIFVTSHRQSPTGGDRINSSLDNHRDVVDEAARKQARRYKEWLMYYQVAFHGGEGSAWNLLTSNEVQELRFLDTGTEHLDLCQHAEKEKDPREANFYATGSARALPLASAASPEIKDTSYYFHRKVFGRKLLSHHLVPMFNYKEKCPVGTTKCAQKELDGMNPLHISGRSYSSFNELNFSDSELTSAELEYLYNLTENVTSILPSNISTSPGNEGEISLYGRRFNDNVKCPRLCSYRMPNYKFYTFNHGTISPWEKLDLEEGQKARTMLSFQTKGDTCMEAEERFETAVSALCSSKELGNSENAILEVSTIWGKLENEILERFTILHEAVVHQLMHLLLTSKVEEVIKACISILSFFILKDGSTRNYIKKTNIDISALNNALNRKIHEAVILIYLLSPTPEEIKGLEILPGLVDAICNADLYKQGPISVPLNPAVAALMMIERLITEFDDSTNNMHVEIILSLRVLPGLVNLISSTNLYERVSLATIFVKCMKSDVSCRNFLAQVTPLAPFIRLLQSKEEYARCAVLELLYEILRLPRSAATGPLRQIRQEGHANIMHTLVACIQQVQLERQLYAANLLIELDIMEESVGKSVFRDEAIEVLLRSVSCNQNSKTQMLAAYILANLGGNYTVTGEPSSIAWLIRKAGLHDSTRRSMLKDPDISDQILQEVDTENWYRKISRSIFLMGNPAFDALGEGLESKIPEVSRNCLVAVARLGYEFTSLGSSLQDSSCDALLKGTTRFLHPGYELEERLLATLFLFNYASSHGMQKILRLSEQIQGPLRRLSNVTWVAEELVKAIDYSTPLDSDKSIAWVHRQILALGNRSNGAVHALVYYRGRLCSGHSDGTIKVWNINARSSQPIHEIKEHRRAVTCFTLFGPGDSLLSGSADNTIRIWQMVKYKLECLSAVDLKEPIHRVAAHDRHFYAITKSRGLKVCDPSGIVRVVCKSKYLQSLFVERSKLYLGCKDSSVQEVDTMTDQIHEIERPARSWWMKSKPISCLLLYKDFIYSAGAAVKGTNIKIRRGHSGCLLSVATACKKSSVRTMAVVEDFVYLSFKSSPSILEVWLREKQQKVTAISAGSRITSLLVANDIVFCGTETGIVKAWISS